MKILFVCTGNTCRSPMAEGLLKDKSPHIEVKSAGIFAMDNAKASDHAITILKEKNIHIEEHRSKAVTKELLHWADIVLTMTTQHKQSLMKEFPRFQEKYFALKEYVKDVDIHTKEALKQAYVDYEEKRTQLIKTYAHQMDHGQLHEEIEKKLSKEWQKIRDLEAQLYDVDISDPFGGSLQSYQETADELESVIEQLLEKIHLEEHGT